MSYPYRKNTQENRNKIAVFLRELANGIENKKVNVIEHSSNGEYEFKVNKTKLGIFLEVEPIENEVDFGLKFRDFGIEAGEHSFFGN